MKRTFAMLLALTIIVSLTACGTPPTDTTNESQTAPTILPSTGSIANETEDPAESSSTASETTGSGNRILIAYFTWADKDRKSVV